MTKYILFSLRMSANTELDSFVLPDLISAYPFSSSTLIIIDWSKIDKEDYLLAMERSPIKNIEIKVLLKAALTDDINDRTVYMKGIDMSFYYEGYMSFKAEEL